MNFSNFRVTNNYILNHTEYAVVSIGYHHRNPKRLIHRVKGTNTYFFVMLHSPGVLGQNQVEAHSFIIWPPHHEHLYGTDQAEWDNSWIHCNGQFVKQILEMSELKMNHIYQMASSNIFEKYIKLLSDEIRNNYNPDVTLLKNNFHNFMIEIERETGHVNSKIPYSYLQVKNYIDSSYNKTLTLDSLAEMAGVSKYHFIKAFKSFFNQTPMEYVTQVKMSHAAHFLSNINLSIQEIAELTGYKDIYYFSIVFKKWYGVSPLKYRQLHFL